MLKLHHLSLGALLPGAGKVFGELLLLCGDDDLPGVDHLLLCGEDDLPGVDHLLLCGEDDLPGIDHLLLCREDDLTGVDHLLQLPDLLLLLDAEVLQLVLPRRQRGSVHQCRRLLLLLLLLCPLGSLQQLLHDRGGPRLLLL